MASQLPRSERRRLECLGGLIAAATAAAAPTARPAATANADHDRPGGRTATGSPPQPPTED
eukprot:scaffold125981_cov28-Tisochrysis_lutea.AAC.3